MSTVQKLVKERNILQRQIQTYRKWLIEHKEPANYLAKFDKVFCVETEGSEKQ